MTTISMDHHPVGASVIHFAPHLILVLSRRNDGVGVARLCGGGGQGEALIFRVSA